MWTQYVDIGPILRQYCLPAGIGQEKIKGRDKELEELTTAEKNETEEKVNGKDNEGKGHGVPLCYQLIIEIRILRGYNKSHYKVHESEVDTRYVDSYSKMSGND